LLYFCSDLFTPFLCSYYWSY